MWTPYGAEPRLRTMLRSVEEAIDVGVEAVSLDEACSCTR